MTPLLVLLVLTAAWLLLAIALVAGLSLLRLAVAGRGREGA